MKTLQLILLVLLSSASLVVGQEKCGNSQINENNGQFPLDEKDKSLTITFSKKQTCTFTVTGFQKMDFEMMVSRFALDPAADCKKDFVQASTKDPSVAQPELSVCVENAKDNSIKSATQKLYIKIQASAPPKPEETRAVTLDFKSVQGPECQPTMISLTGARLSQSYPPAQSKLLPADCDIQVTGYNGRDFKMTIPAIDFDSDCTKSYVAAADTKDGLKTASYKHCGKSPITEAINSKASAMFLKVITKDGAVADPKVTFLFQTIYPECGASEIRLNNGTQQLSLPATGNFPANSECTIKITGIDNKDFKMTIKNINFPVKCEEGSVTAAGTLTALPNKNYTKCGNAPVEDPIQSVNGVLYVQIMLGAIGETKPTVTLEFTSGAGKSGHYAFVALIIFKFVSLTIW